MHTRHLFIYLFVVCLTTFSGSNIVYPHQVKFEWDNVSIYLIFGGSHPVVWHYKHIYFYVIHNNNKTHNIKCYNLMVLGYIFRPHCGHLQANLYRLSGLNVRTIWDLIMCTVMTYVRLKTTVKKECYFNLTYVMIVQTMRSHIVRTLKPLNLYKLTWRWPQCGRNMYPRTIKL